MIRINRLWLVGFVCLFAQTTFSQPNSNQSQGSPLDPRLGITTVPLWNGSAPESKGTEADDIPTLTVFTPQRGQGNGAAVVIAPGGAYRGLAINHEGRQMADWFTAHGVTAFVLKYRLGTKYIYPIPLMDAQRAIRWVRAHHATYGIDPARVGMIGFSAGGHLAAMASVSPDFQGKLEAADSIDRLNAKPDFLMLGYPWINAMQPSAQPFIDSYQTLMRLPEENARTFETSYTPTLLVSSETPTTFIFSTTDDRVVSIQASLDFYAALVKSGVPVEMHLFRHGAHGMGLGEIDTSVGAWTTLLGQWLRDQGFLSQGK